MENTTFDHALLVELLEEGRFNLIKVRAENSENTYYPDYISGENFHQGIPICFAVVWKLSFMVFNSDGKRIHLSTYGHPLPSDEDFTEIVLVDEPNHP